MEDDPTPTKKKYATVITYTLHIYRYKFISYITGLLVNYSKPEHEQGETRNDLPPKNALTTTFVCTFIYVTSKKKNPGFHPPPLLKMIISASHILHSASIKRTFCFIRMGSQQCVERFS